MPEEFLDKEAIGFITRFFGGTASVGAQMLFDWWHHEHPEARDKFPYTRPHEKLPAYHNMIVSGISIGEALIGLGIEEDPLEVFKGLDSKAKENLKEFGKGLREFGEGGVLYTVPRLTRITITKNIPMPTAGAKSQRQTRQPATRRGRVIKL